MRLFIAFEIPRERLADLEQVAEQARVHYPGGRPVPAENLHVTVHFAGECDRRQAEALRKATAAAYQTSVSERPAVFPADLSVTRPGCFRMRDNGVLWLAVEPAGPILRFHARLMESLTALGLPGGNQRLPVPHITIARDLPASECRAVAAESATPLRDGLQTMHFRAEGPSLMESCQGKGRMIYRARCRPAVDEGWIVAADP